MVLAVDYYNPCRSFALIEARKVQQIMRFDSPGLEKEGNVCSRGRTGAKGNELSPLTLEPEAKRMKPLTRPPKMNIWSNEVPVTNSALDSIVGVNVNSEAIRRKSVRGQNDEGCMSATNAPGCEILYPHVF